MSTTTATNAPANRAATTSAPAARGRVTFLHLLRSEWIKLLSLRSTWWTLGLTVLGMVAFSLLMSASAGFIADQGVPTDSLGAFGAQVATFGYGLGQVTVAVLGALIITGEYSTGMIRSTLAAAPRRTDAVLAKAVVLAGVVAVTSLAAILLSWAVTTPILSNHDLQADLGDGETWRIFLGATAYIVLISLLSFGLGLVLRSSAGAIAAVLGIVLMLPVVLSLLGVWQTWIADVAPFMPSSAGERLMAGSGDVDMGMAMGGVPGEQPLSPLAGGAVLLGYVAVVVGTGLALLKKRDV